MNSDGENQDEVNLNGAPILSIQNLEKTREQGGARFTLRVPRFQLGRGEFVAVTGDSGCGKSTLLDLLALVLKPSGCQVFQLNLSGQATDVDELWREDNEAALAGLRRKGFGYVLQNGGLLPFLTTRDNIKLAAEISGRPVSGELINHLAEQIGIAAILNKKPQHLSGGQRQRAAILRAICHQPPIILADEPTAAVDKTRARAIVADFAELARKSALTVVMVSHDVDLLKPVADRAYGFTLESTGERETLAHCIESNLELQQAS